MSAGRQPTGRDERLDLLDAVIYGDAFDCAVTFDELWRFGRAPIGRAELRRRLRDDPALGALLVERDGLYCLEDRQGLLDGRPERIRRARVLQRRARRVARVLRELPFVRGLALTGSVAADDAQEGADLDLLVIVAPDRLGSVFVLLGSASRLLGRRLFCPNYYLSADRLVISPSSLYIARELSHARSLAGSADSMRVANHWLVDVFPNAPGVPALETVTRSGVQRLLEAPFSGRLGDRVERRARRVAVARLRAHYGGFGCDVPAEVAASFEAAEALRFHAGNVVETILRRYEARRAELAARLEQFDRESTPTGSSAQ